MDGIDDLQGRLSSEVFARTKSPRKAAGRALGTLVEIVAYYVLLSWGLRDSISIETPLGEYGARNIVHNVDYSLHPIFEKRSIAFPRNSVISSRNIHDKLLLDGVDISDIVAKNLVSKNKTLKNSCMINRGGRYRWIANLNADEVVVTRQRARPFMMVECKRVGIDARGNTGPQAIEKAKQGSYVARAVSSLQKIRDNEGALKGVLYDSTNTPIIDDYENLVRRVMASDDQKILSDFILTTGVVSDHGNWFTSDTSNRELDVLRQSYDWLLFLTDRGLSCFVEEAIMSGRYPKTQKAFYSSYEGTKHPNQFTKSNMHHDAHVELLRYFAQNKTRVGKWLNVVSPQKKSLGDLKEQICKLRNKEWAE